MARKIKTAKTTAAPAEICLYGNREIGAGWLARTPDGRLLGDGDPVEGRMFTEAVWQAQDALEAAGVKGGRVRIFAAGGQRMAEEYLTHRAYFGDLKWTAAPVIEISVEAILAAATPPQ